MVFVKSAIEPGNTADQAYYVCFQDADVLLQVAGANRMFPLFTEEKAREFCCQDRSFIGWLNDKPCYAAVKAEKIVSDGYEWVCLRDFYLNGERALSDIAGYAKQLSDWNINFRFCGRCASATLVLPNEHARQCEKCRLVNFPRISPAVIAAVIKDDHILLARGRNYSDKDMFSVLAGFVEAGESLETAVKREIMEEVGIVVTNIKYFKSQSWPFPDSLMIGFTADYLSGNILIDENEIAEAGWFKAGALPKVPAKRSIAGELIHRFVSANRQ